MAVARRKESPGGWRRRRTAWYASSPWFHMSRARCSSATGDSNRSRGLWGRWGGETREPWEGGPPPPLTTCSLPCRFSESYHISSCRMCTIYPLLGPAPCLTVHSPLLRPLPTVPPLPPTTSAGQKGATVFPHVEYAPFTSLAPPAGPCPLPHGIPSCPPALPPAPQ